jgi:hypothetical protein
LAIEEQQDDDDDGYDAKNPRRLLLSGKNNLGPKAAGIGYRLGLRHVSNFIEAPYVNWDDEPVDITADEALQAASGGHKDNRIDDAKNWLREFLTKDPKPADEVKKAAAQQDISVGTLKRAKKSLRVVSFRSGFGEGSVWQWGLPKQWGLPTKRIRAGPKSDTPGDGVGKKKGNIRFAQEPLLPHEGRRSGRR